MKCYDNWRAIYGMTCFTDQSGLEHREHTQTHTHTYSSILGLTFWGHTNAHRNQHVIL